MNINEQAQDIHRRNHKWWHDRDGNRLVRNRGELLMLVVSELAEAMEALRKDMNDDKLPHRKGEEVELADAYIRLLDFAAGFGIELDADECNTYNAWYVVYENKAQELLHVVGEVWWTYWEYSDDFPDENEHISRAVASIIGYCHHYSLDLQGAVAEKLAYNDTREDHTWEAREAANGKKF